MLLLLSSVDLGGLLIAFAKAAFAIMLISIALSILIIVANWKLFTKAGEEGWKCLIPVYNVYVVIKIAFSGTKNYLIVATILPLFTVFLGDSWIVSLIALATVIINIYIGFNFMKRYTDTGMAVLSLFFPMIIYPIVAFSDKYQYTEYTY